MCTVSYLDSSLCTFMCKALILNGLVALTGVEPGFAAFSYFLQVTETAKAGSAAFARISGLLYKTCTRTGSQISVLPKWTGMPVGSLCGARYPQLPKVF